MRLLTLSTLASVLLGFVPGVFAGNYDALCAPEEECKVTIGNGVIMTPEVIVPTSTILSWTTAGEGTTTDIGLGVTLTLLFGVSGLLGFMAQEHDYQYFINYVDSEAIVHTLFIAFENDSPADRFRRELEGTTGLTENVNNPNLVDSTGKWISLPAPEKSATAWDMKFANENNAFFTGSPNPNFKVGYQDWVLLQSNFDGYDFKYSPPNTITQGKFVNVQVFQQNRMNPNLSFVQTIRVDCQNFMSSYFLVDAPPFYRQFLNRWFEPKRLLPDSPGSAIAKKYCQNKNFL